MKSFFSIGLRGKINILVVAVGVVCAISIAIISSVKSKDSLETQVSGQLKASSIMMKDKLTGYFNNLETFTSRLSKDRLIEGLFIAFEGSYYGGAYPENKDNNIYSNTYVKNDKKYGDRVRQQAKEYGMKSIMLASMAGPIVMTSNKDAKGLLLGKDLKSGSMKKSALAKCYTQAAGSKGKKVFYTGYEFIKSVGKVSSFLCKKMFAEFDHEDEGIYKGDDLGVVITEIDLNTVNTITGLREGMGETGQFYIVGNDHLLKTSLFVEKEKFNVDNSLKKKIQIKTEYVAKALKGGEGFLHALGPNGYDVLSYYSPLTVFGMTWAFIAEKSDEELLSPVVSMVKFIALVTLVIIAVTIFLSLYLTKILSNPITHSTDTLKVISGEVQGNSNDMKSFASNLNECSSDLSSSVHETMSTLDELTQMVSKNMENVERSSETSKVSKNAAEGGLETINNLLKAFGEITDSNGKIVQDMDDTTKQMMEISNVINEIAEKTTVINDIVFQTKLLAFNASVEAARAGEHGKGFAVVAEEVGNLASASGKASQEITEMVTDSVSKVEKIVSNTKQRIEASTALGKEKVDNGYGIAQECGKGLELILKNVNEVNDSINEVRVASQEQSLGISEVSKAMNILDNVANNTDKMSSELLEASGVLETKSEGLSGVVGDLESLLEGKSLPKGATEPEAPEVSSESDDELKLVG